MEAVVLQYQRDHGLTADGIVGHDTFMFLIAK
ncbi:peptidoglycan-binding domain-containing protein [Blautia marasmi]